MTEGEISAEEILDAMRELDEEPHAQDIARALDVPVRQLQPRLNRLAKEDHVDRVHLGSESRLTFWRLQETEVD